MSEGNYVRVTSFSKNRRTAEITVTTVYSHGGVCKRGKRVGQPRRVSITLHVDYVGGNTYRSLKVDSEGNPWTFTLI